MKMCFDFSVNLLSKLASFLIILFLSAMLTFRNLVKEAELNGLYWLRNNPNWFYLKSKLMGTNCLQFWSWITECMSSALIWLISVMYSYIFKWISMYWNFLPYWPAVSCLSNVRRPLITFKPSWHTIVKFSSSPFTQNMQSFTFEILC